MEAWAQFGLLGVVLGFVLLRLEREMRAMRLAMANVEKAILLAIVSDHGTNNIARQRLDELRTDEQHRHAL